MCSFVVVKYYYTLFLYLLTYDCIEIETLDRDKKIFLCKKCLKIINYIMHIIS